MSIRTAPQWQVAGSKGGWKAVTGPSARHVEHRARVEPARVGTEPGDEVRDFVGGTQALHGAVGDHPLDYFDAEVTDHIGVDRVWSDTLEYWASTDLRWTNLE